MARRVFLHVGTPKSGTTFLQTTLWAGRDVAADRELLVPGERLYDHNRSAQAMRGAGADRRRPRRRQRETWQRVRAEIAAWPGDVILSNEWLVLADADAARAASEALAPAEVHVVVTARDLSRLVPTAWQELVKLGQPVGLDEFVAGLDEGVDRWSWRALDPVCALHTWAADLPPERAHVVTVPPPGADPSLLWRRFAGVVGVDPGGFDLGAARPNESLGAEAAALLQRTGPALRAAVAPPGSHWINAHRWIRGYLAHELLVPRGGSRIALGPAAAERVRVRATASVRALEQGGWRLAGDLSDLLPAPVADGRHPDDVGDDELLALVGPVLGELLSRVRAASRTADDEDED